MMSCDQTTVPRTRVIFYSIKLEHTWRTEGSSGAVNRNSFVV